MDQRSKSAGDGIVSGNAMQTGTLAAGLPAHGVFDAPAERIDCAVDATSQAAALLESLLASARRGSDPAAYGITLRVLDLVGTVRDSLTDGRASLGDLRERVHHDRRPPLERDDDAADMPGVVGGALAAESTPGGTPEDTKALRERLALQAACQISSLADLLKKDMRHADDAGPFSVAIRIGELAEQSIAVMIDRIADLNLAHRAIFGVPLEGNEHA